MAIFTLNIPAARLNQLLAGFKSRYGYQEQVLDESDEFVSNPETLVQFSKRMLNDHLRGLYIEGAEVVAKEAVLTATQAASTESEDITTT